MFQNFSRVHIGIEGETRSGSVLPSVSYEFNCAVRWQHLENLQAPPERKTVLSFLQGIHRNCHPDSKCKNPSYQCSKVRLTNPRAIAALHKFILQSNMYKLAKDYYLVNPKSFLPKLERVEIMAFSEPCIKNCVKTKKIII